MTSHHYALSSGFGPYGDLACCDEYCQDEFGFVNPEIPCDFWDKVAELVDRIEVSHGHIPIAHVVTQTTKINITEEDLEKGSIASAINAEGNRWFRYSDGTYSYINRNGSVFIK